MNQYISRTVHLSLVPRIEASQLTPACLLKITAAVTELDTRMITVAWLIRESL